MNAPQQGLWPTTWGSSSDFYSIKERLIILTRGWVKRQEVHGERQLGAPIDSSQHAPEFLFWIKEYLGKVGRGGLRLCLHRTLHNVDNITVSMSPNKVITKEGSPTHTHTHTPHTPRLAPHTTTGPNQPSELKSKIRADMWATRLLSEHQLNQLCPDQGA